MPSRASDWRPAWLAEASAVAIAAEPAADDSQLSPFEPEPEALPDESWDWFDHISRADRIYLLAPRTTIEPCPWCRGRTRHSEACEQLHDEWSMPMPFGKHKGKPVRRLPADYLEWLAGLKLGGDLASEVNRVLNRRDCAAELAEMEANA